MNITIRLTLVFGLLSSLNSRTMRVENRITFKCNNDTMVSMKKKDFDKIPVFQELPLENNCTTIKFPDSTITMLKEIFEKTDDKFFE